MARQYDNRGRDQFNIENARDVYVGKARSRKRPHQEMTWLKAFEKDIEGWLADSLHNQILINLGKKAQPEQVHRLWDMEIKSGRITETIPPETEISEVFDRVEVAGKLLILGKPGAGKTTTLLELARALVKRAIDDPSEPMPFLLNLSSWKDPNQTIQAWVIEQLKTKGVGSKLGAKWIADRKVIPLLDGLDEVRSDLQPACVKAINRYLSGEQQPRTIVVCSRREEYELYPEKLNLNGAVYLQELSDEQIETYLGKVDRAPLWQVLEADAALLDLVRQPLWLSITLAVYQKELVEQWRGLRTTQERLTFLLDAYVEKMLRRQIESRFYSMKEPTEQKTRKWLVRLAQQLQHDDETEFLIEKMQPAWLKNACQRWIYRLIFGLIFGLILGLFFGLAVAPSGKLINRLIGGLLFGLIGGLIIGPVVSLTVWLVGNISLSSESGEPSESGLDAPIKSVYDLLMNRLLFVTFTIIPMGFLLVGLLFVPILGSDGGLLVGLIGLIGVLIGTLIGGVDCISPLEKIKISLSSEAINQQLSGGIMRGFIGLIFGLMIGRMIGLGNDGGIVGLIAGLIGGFISEMISIAKTEITMRNLPNQGIISSVKNVVIIVSTSLLIAALIQGFLSQFIGQFWDKNSTSVVLVTAGLTIAWTSFQEGGGKACIQHFSLRLVLFFNRAIPWNYARFLNYATERMFLQRIGGQYRFIHKLLQDHFAQME